MADPISEPVYAELRRVARRYLERERVGHSLQPTDLVHEAYAKLAGRDAKGFADRVHLLATGARAMREILVDHARARLAAKRGGGGQRITLHEDLGGLGAGKAEIDVLALDDALAKLAELDERQARVVELRFFGGLTIEETAAELGVSHMTVSSDWRTARAWLAAELEP